MNKTPPHIAFYLRCLFDGGVERVLANLSHYFIEQGLKVDLVLNEAGGPYLDKFPSQVRIVELKTPRLLKSLPKLVRYLRQEQPTILLSAVHFAPEIAILAKYIAMVSTKMVVAEHTTTSVEVQQGNPLGNKTKSNLIPIASRLLYPWADEIIAVSHAVAKDLASTAKLPLERIRVIYNPTVTPQLSEKAKEILEHPWFASGQPPVILGVGRLEPQKNFANLIRAFAQVREVRPARLMILGQGREQPQLNNLVQELDLENYIAMPGFVQNPYAYMAKAAAFVLSSNWEGLPVALIEAMAVGTPVISTNCPGGSAEILDNGKYGFLVPVGNSQAIAEAILEILSGNSKSIDPAWLEQFSGQTAGQQYLDALGIALQ